MEPGVAPYMDGSADMDGRGGIMYPAGIIGRPPGAPKGLLKAGSPKPKSMLGGAAVKGTVAE